MGEGGGKEGRNKDNMENKRENRRMYLKNAGCEEKKQEGESDGRYDHGNQKGVDRAGRGREKG